MIDASITTAARRLCREANGPNVVPGWIYLVDLSTGRIGQLVDTYAADQPSREWRAENRKCLMRISNGRITEREAQRIIDTLGEGE